MMIRRYSELSKLGTFEERYQYLMLKGKVGIETFGVDRIFNQRFYRSVEWRKVRDIVLIRDTGLSTHCCDLGVYGYEIYDSVIIHHMNPITIEDIEVASEWLLNPEYLISTTLNTHNAIHYGTDLSSVKYRKTERYSGDTCPWKVRENQNGR